MKIGQFGNWDASHLDALAAQLSVGSGIEHKPDGTHGSVHCETITERGRILPMGEWQDVPFDKANFTADSPATWTVPAAGHLTYAYTLVGKTATVQFRLDAGSVAGGTPTQLHIKLPPELVPSHHVLSPTLTVFIVGVRNNVGELRTVPDSGRLLLYSDFSATPWPVTAGTIYVRGSLTFPIR